MVPLPPGSGPGLGLWLWAWGNIGDIGMVIFPISPLTQSTHEYLPITMSRNHCKTLIITVGDIGGYRTPYIPLLGGYRGI